MKTRLIYLAYSIIYGLLLPVILLRMWIRGGKAPEYRKRWRERFGYQHRFAKRPILFHTVSLGEAIAATPVIEALLSQYPNIPLLVTTTTPTGSAHIQEKFAGRVCHQYLPYDLPWLASAFLRHTHPVLILLMETELWPNYLRIARQLKIPSVLINARLSQRSADNYAKFGWISRPMLSDLSAILCQGDSDKQRFLELLSPDSSPDQQTHPTSTRSRPQIQVMGSVKYDFEPAPDLVEQAQQMFGFWSDSSPVWVAASTHPGEEEMVLTTHQQLLASFPGLKLILVPRHPERFNEVAELIESMQLNGCRRSQPEKSSADASVFLCDTMGELMICYQRADIALIGGSLITRGGHNPLEPAALGKAIVTGPHVFNFEAIYEQLTDARACIVASDQEQLKESVSYLLNHPEQRTQMGLNASAFQQRNKGAVTRCMNYLRGFIDEQDSSQ